MWLAVVLLPMGLFAEPLRTVYLNGVTVRDPRGLRLTNVDVEIDQEGNIRILTRGEGVAAGTEKRAPASTGGSSVTGVSPTAPPTGKGSTPPGATGGTPTAGPGSSPSVQSAQTPGTTADAAGAERDPRPLEGRYWIATQDLSGQATGWTVDVQLNGQRVGTFTSGEPRVVEVTSSLRRGENVIRLEFRRASAAPVPAEAGVFELVLAPGAVQLEQDSIALSYPILTARRGASDDPAAVEELRFMLPPPVRP